MYIMPDTILLLILLVNLAIECHVCVCTCMHEKRTWDLHVACKLKVYILNLFKPLCYASMKEALS